MLESEHASPGGAEEVNPLEPEVRTHCVDLFAEDGNRPLDVARAIRTPAADLVVDDDRALVNEPLERAEVVVRRPRAAVKSKKWRCWGLEIADESIPGAVAPIVEIALRNRRIHRWRRYR